VFCRWLYEAGTEKLGRLKRNLFLRERGVKLSFIKHLNNEIMVRRFSLRIIYFIVFVLLILPCNGLAQMREMNDAELSMVYATGLRVKCDVSIETYTTIDALRMGHYNGGWDENWRGVSLGKSTTGFGLIPRPLTCNGLYLDLATEDGSLKEIKMGTTMTGTISADSFDSFSGEIAGVQYSRADLGSKKIICNNTDFYISLSKEGYRVHFDNATIK